MLLLRRHALFITPASFFLSPHADFQRARSVNNGHAERQASNFAASGSGRDHVGNFELQKSECVELESGLYVVGTPIGNLEDITIRALRVLSSADVILAEDTRHSQKLLNHYSISTRVTSFHAHNEHAKQEQVLQMLRSGKRVALISDAGMPLVSDPGAKLVRAVVEQKGAVIPIPGPSAVLSALVASGLQTDSFLFCGFLPPKSKARKAAIAKLAGTQATLVFFVALHSLVHVLCDLEAGLSGDRRCAVAREVTKVHEEFFRGTLSAAHAEFSSRAVKGEVTLIVEGAPQATEVVSDEDLEKRMDELLSDGCSASSAAKILAKSFGLPRSPVYTLALKLKERREGQSLLDFSDADESLQP